MRRSVSSAPAREQFHCSIDKEHSGRKCGFQNLGGGGGGRAFKLAQAALTRHQAENLFWQPRQLVLAGWIAFRARHPGAAVLARVRTAPWLIWMVLANPAAVLAKQAVHSPSWEIRRRVANLCCLPVRGLFRLMCTCALFFPVRKRTIDSSPPGHSGILSVTERPIA